jgi:spore germination protein YaaH
MIHHVRNLLLSLIYLAAIAIAVLLVYRTLQLARQGPDMSLITSQITVTTIPLTTTRQAAVITTTTTTNRGPMSAAEATPMPSVAVTPGLALDDEAVNLLAADTATGYHPKTGRYISAWMPPVFSGGARESFEANMDIIDEICPFWYTTDDTGQLYGTRDDELVRVAHENNVMVLPTLHNVANYDAVINVLSDPAMRTRHVQNIVNEVLTYGYDGIDIDYEGLDTSMRDDFSAFIVELAAALHSHDKLLSIAVHAKDRDYGGLGGYQDWDVIGAHVDRFRIMTYDYHWRGGGPGPVAPLYWIQSVAEYARSQVDPTKVFIGIPFYGYDWPPTGNATALPWTDIEDLIEEEDLTVNLMQRDRSGRVDESWFRYPSDDGMREVWFMTSSGLESKLDLVQSMDLAGIAIWRIGYERPEYWDVIRRTLVQDPMLIQKSINPLLPEH